MLFDETTLKVFKSTGEELLEVSGEENNQNGWKYIGFKTNHPTTYEPFVGENKSAHMIELFGNAKVSYPECLFVSFDSPVDYYGYASLSAKPLEGSIKIKNGELLPEDAWEYIGYKDEQNLRVQGPNNPEEPFLEAFPNVPAEGKYIIRFSENYIYEKSGDLIEITFDPKGT